MEFRSRVIFPTAVPIHDARVIWGVHRGHQAARPGLSPFVDRPVPANWLGKITVELVGTPETPLLVRAYGGEYTPPLPWMRSAQEATGGEAAAQKYWRTHAYLLVEDSLILPGTRTVNAPQWFHSA